MPACVHWCVRTSAVAVFLPHHHLLILFSSREKGNSLAEAEAALSSTRVMLHLGALNTVLSLSICSIFTLKRLSQPSIKVHIRAVLRNVLLLQCAAELTWCASLLSFPSPSSPRGCLRPSGCPWEPLRLVIGQGPFRYSDTTCKMQDASSGTAMPSASRICHLKSQKILR